jgi:dihydrofolate reductase
MYKLNVGVVAISKNNAIGKNNTLPWDYHKDLKWFRTITQDGTVIMGRRTYESFSDEKMPNRLNIVMTTKLIPSKEVIYLQSKQSVTNLIKYLDGFIFNIGGSMIFSLLGEYIDEWLVTRIPEVIEDADTFMKDDFLNGFFKSNVYNLDEGLICEHWIRNGKKEDDKFKERIRKVLKEL